MPDKLVAKLNSPPVIPINSLGATSEMTVHPRPTIPWPKNATDKMAITRVSLDRYANCDGVFVLVCSGSLEANSVKKLIKIVYNLLIEPIQLSSFVVRELGVSPVRLKYASSEG